MLALTLAWRFTPLAEVVTADHVTRWSRALSSRWWAPVVLVLAHTPASLVMFPRPLLTLAAVVAFGPWLGFALSMAGVLLATLATYLMGLAMSREAVNRLAGRRLDHVTTALRRRGLVAVIALRLVPLAPFAIEGVVAGAMRIALSDLLLGTAIGMAPGMLATTVFGQQIETALHDPSRVNYWIVGAVVVVLVGGTLWVKQWIGQVAETATRSASRSRG